MMLHKDRLRAHRVLFGFSSSFLVFHNYGLCICVSMMCVYGCVCMFVFGVYICVYGVCTHVSMVCVYVCAHLSLGYICVSMVCVHVSMVCVCIGF